MAINYNPQIVTDGLVLCLDAANKDSYPGTGTTWYDISGNERHATLVNGPTFTNLKGGSFSFDGTNDYAQADHNIDVTTTPLTMSMWVMTTSSTYTSIEYYIAIGKNTSFGIARKFITATDSVFIGKHTEWMFGQNGYYGSELISTNTFYNIVVSANPLNNTITYYFNGFKSTLTSTVNVNLDTMSKIYLGYALVLGSNAYSRYYISNASIYNRILSDIEVQQNFNATRWRFGI